MKSAINVPLERVAILVDDNVISPDKGQALAVIQIAIELGRIADSLEANQATIEQQAIFDIHKLR